MMVITTNGYETKIFTAIYDKWETFQADYTALGIPKMITQDNLKVLYYLLYAKFGNSPIANMDENQFKYKLFTTIWQYGPAWEKKLDIQDKIRSLTTDDLLQGAKAIHNHAYNPSTEPSTATLEELTYINDQNTTQYKKSKMDAYGQLWTLLATDVTSEFLNRFNPLFKQFVIPGTYLYESEE